MAAAAARAELAVGLAKRGSEVVDCDAAPPPNPLLLERRVLLLLLLPPAAGLALDDSTLPLRE